MKPAQKVVWEDRPARYRRPLIQAIAVALVSIIFIGLILIMGIRDLRTIDRTLMGFLENRGQGVINVVERLAQENINTLVQGQQQRHDDTFVPLAEEAFSPQRLLIRALVNIGREVDTNWKADRLSENTLRKMVAEKGLWMIAVFDKGGRAVFQSRSLPSSLAGSQGAEGGVAIEDFARLGRDGKIGFIALRRRDGSGTIIIALDPKGARYWGLKVAIEKAIGELGAGQRQNLLYLVIMDRQGKVLGSTGRGPQTWRPGEFHLPELLDGRRKIDSRKGVWQGKNILDMAIPVTLNNRIEGVARIGLDRSGSDTILRENERNMLVFMVFIAAIMLLVMGLLYFNQNRHMERLVEITRQLEKAERLSALGQLAAGVAHEIRNPLNAISMASQRLKREYLPDDPDKVRDFGILTGVIRDEIRRLNGIIEEFLTFSKSRRLELREYSVVEVLQKIVNLVQEEAVTKDIALETRWGEDPLVIPMDVDKLQQAMLNFIKNAMESISGAGTVLVSAALQSKERLVITVSDTGCGMTPEEVERIFNPEYTTKEKGLGLGMTLAHEIIRGHGGEIRVKSEAGAGTAVEVILPTEIRKS
jgi:signal transduction histidine kinase